MKINIKVKESSTIQQSNSQSDYMNRIRVFSLPILGFGAVKLGLATLKLKTTLLPIFDAGAAKLGATQE
jgi:hypothetical protein